MEGININPNDSAAVLSKELAPTKISDDLTVTVRSVDELPEEQRCEILGVQPPRSNGVRVIPATGWYRKF